MPLHIFYQPKMKLHKLILSREAAEHKKLFGFERVYLLWLKITTGVSIKNVLLLFYPDFGLFISPCLLRKMKVVFSLDFSYLYFPSTDFEALYKCSYSITFWNKYFWFIFPWLPNRKNHSGKIVIFLFISIFGVRYDFTLSSIDSIAKRGFSLDGLKSKEFRPLSLSR